MTIDWDFGDQKAMEPSSHFTQNADVAFDNFCKEYLYDPNKFHVTPKSEMYINQAKSCELIDKKRDAYKNPLYEDFYKKENNKDKEFKKSMLNNIIETCRRDFDKGNDQYLNAKNNFDKELGFQFENSKGKLSDMKIKPYHTKDPESYPIVYKSRDEIVYNQRKSSGISEQNKQKINQQSQNQNQIKTSYSSEIELGSRLSDDLITYPKSNKFSKKRKSKDNLKIRPKSVYNFDEINDGFVVKTYEQFKNELLKFSKIAALKKQKNEKANVENKKTFENNKKNLIDEMNNLKIEKKNNGLIKSEKLEENEKDFLENKKQSSGNIYESLTQDDIYLTSSNSLKKQSFTNEFTKYKKNNKQQPIDKITTNFKPTDECDKPNESEKRLSLKVVACGMKKYGKLPIPTKNYFIEKGDFGDDAGFWSETKDGCACGIADGATGNANYGYDPGDFSRNLMKQCSELFTKNDDITDSRDLLLKAYDIVQDKECYGSCTSCVIALDRRSHILTAVNVGDSGYCLIREGRIVHISEPQRISNECPKQLDSYPWKEESRKMGVSYTEILGSDTMCDSIDVLKDDIIIISSDGLYDNMDYEEIEEICYKSKTMMDAVERIVYRTVKYNRKPDDILVLIARVIETTTISSRNIFSQA